MSALFIILCAVSITASLFLVFRFAIKKKDSDTYINVSKQQGEK